MKLWKSMGEMEIPKGLINAQQELLKVRFMAPSQQPCKGASHQ